MPYPTPRGRLGDSAGGQIIIDSISPARPFAGPGLQLVTLTGHGFQRAQPPGVTRYPLVFSAYPNSDASQPGAFGTLVSVSPDGTQAVFAVDFRGIVDPFGFGVIVSDFVTHDQTNATLQTQPGVPPLYTAAPKAARHDPTIVSAVLVTHADASGVMQVLTGGVSNVTVAGSGTGAPRGLAYPGPGILTWNGTAWDFTPMEALSLGQLNQMFPDVALNPNLEVDPFGLPLPSAHQPFPVPVFRPDGTPVYSPWFAARHAPVADVPPSTVLPPTYQAYFPDAQPSTTTIDRPVLLAPVVTQDADGNVIPGTAIDGPASTSAPAIVSTLPSTQLVLAGGGGDMTAPAKMSPLLLLALAVGGYYLLSQQGRR